MISAAYKGCSLVEVIYSTIDLSLPDEFISFEKAAVERCIGFFNGKQSKNSFPKVDRSGG
jgi:hypothetical protein